MTPITPEILIKAYSAGIFPMAETRDAEELYWVDPKMRGIIPLYDFKISRSLARTIRKGTFRVTADTAFEKVMRLCGSKIAGREETWINDEIMELYQALFQKGLGHSIEVWKMGRLVGGLYGIAIGGAFFGESKFHLERDASKVALAHTVARLKNGGYKLFDIQFLTPHLAGFGATEIPRVQYKRALRRALGINGNFKSLGQEPEPEAVLQSIAQTS